MNEPPNLEVAVFAAVLELPADQRGAYLDEACAGDVALRREVEALLRVQVEAGNFFDKLGSVARPTSAEEAMAGSSGTVQLSAIAAQKTGDRIGRYKLLQQIGEGGCGVVYMAEQEEPMRRRVALKVIKLGMDTKSVIARFEAERQALALMDHPNIAKVLDAGATDTGRPYFVMELVRGIKITDYCDENNLSTVARLELFVLVCQAIQHAHQKGIIHRDIKPSNILVADHDGVPVPKIIDFGIAKATTDQRLTDKTVFTAFEQFIGTPAYMSPEQARLSGLDIDTRSDIYSLGVLLYELLTAKTPFEANRLVEAGLDEIRRMIREEEPVRPSTRLQTLEAAEQTTVARHRQCEPPKLFGIIRGDLDWIVMKALEKDRARRYETANGLAADVQRHLENEPVLARPPGNLYKFHKMVRRNTLAFVAAFLVVTAVFTGLGLATFGLLQARRERNASALAKRLAEQERAAADKSRQQAEVDKQKAQTEAAKSAQVSAFLGEMVKGVSPWVASGRDTTVLREIVDKAAKRLGTDLDNQPEVEIELRTTIGRVYQELGDNRKARAVLRDALAKARKLWGNDDLRWAGLFQNFALASDDTKAAEILQREVLAIRRKNLGKESPEVGETLRELANVLRKEGRLAETEQLDRESLAIQWKTWPQGHPQIAASLLVLAGVLGDEGRWPEEETAASQSLSMLTKMSSGENPEVSSAVGKLGCALMNQGKLPDAELMLRKALAMKTKLFGRQNPDVAVTLDQLANTLKAQSKPGEAVALTSEAQAIRKALSAGGNHELAGADSLINLAEAYLALDRQADAEQAYWGALAVITKSGAAGNDDYGPTAQSLRDLLAAENKTAELEKLYQEVIAALGNDSILLSSAVVPKLVEAGEKQQVSNICRMALNSASTNALWFNNTSWCLATTVNPTNRDPALAAELAKRAVEINPAGDWNTVGVAYYRIGDFKQAVETLAKQVKNQGWGSSTDLFFQAMAEYKVGHADAARRYYVRAIQWMNEHDPHNPEILRFRAETERLLGSGVKAGTENPPPVPPGAK